MRSAAAVGLLVRPHPTVLTIAGLAVITAVDRYAAVTRTTRRECRTPWS
jgi:hypothetical protein